MRDPLAGAIGSVMTGDGGMRHLLELCDTIGERPAGSDGERLASEYLVAAMKAVGLDDVKREPFEAVHWQRGTTEAALVAPVRRPVELLALPNNTSHELEAEVVWAPFETLEAFREAAPGIKGKIVLNAAQLGIGLSGKMLHRSQRVGLAAEAGAAAFLWMSQRSGHVLPTGSMDREIARTMPGFGISLEDGLLIRRLLERADGPVRMTIRTDNTLSNGTSWNVSGEAGTGSGPLVLVTAHYDSHDITVGAFDNAAGCAVVLEAARALAPAAAAAGCRFRFVIFSAEETGLQGSRHYVREHESELGDMRFLLNADGLGATPSWKYVHVPFRADVAAWLSDVRDRFGFDIEIEEALALNWDHAPFALRGVPVASITAKWPAGTLLHYGHSSADTPDKIDPQDLRYAAACATLLAGNAALADWPFAHLDAATVAARLEGVPHGTR